MTWLLQIGYRNVNLEVDSQLLVDWIRHKAKPPWNTDTQVQQLKEFIRQTGTFKCKHTYRNTSQNIYSNNQQLLKEARGYYQLDILEMEVSGGGKSRGSKSHHE
ncbi:hypothetical protein RDI58_013392 [Solanum bulbocastanum]|uniref:RNase H type-1 domain-containing protein n=1 Tax=Solanum bulbocastanum TaxID=147425 RepID=A0AAN8TQT1_SOLBU